MSCKFGQFLLNLNIGKINESIAVEISRSFIDILPIFAYLIKKLV